MIKSKVFKVCVLIVKNVCREVERTARKTKKNRKRFLYQWRIDHFTKADWLTHIYNTWSSMRFLGRRQILCTSSNTSFIVMVVQRGWWRERSSFSCIENTHSWFAHASSMAEALGCECRLKMEYIQARIFHFKRNLDGGWWVCGKMKGNNIQLKLKRELDMICKRKIERFV